MPKVKTLAQKQVDAEVRNIRFLMLEAKREKKLRYEDIAEKADMTTDTCFRAIKNPDNSKTDTLLKIMNVLGLTVVERS